MRRAALALCLFTSAAYGAEVCPVDSRPLPPAAAQASVARSLSAAAEAVAPSAVAGRRRASLPPAGALPVANYVDTWIAAKQVRDGVKPTALAGDAEFLRRVSLDLTGQLPTSAEVLAFLAEGAANKRAKKIEELLASDAFVDRWTLWFGDLVQNVQVANNTREYYQGRNAYYSWMRDSIRASKPYDAMVREALATRGDSFAAGAPNYVVRQLQRNGPAQDTYDNLAAHAGEKFLGMPLLCLSCHSGTRHLEQVNSYLAGKTRTDFWKMAAFFARTTARPLAGDPNNANVRKFDVQDNTTGRYLLNTTDGNKSPRTPASGQSNVVAPAFLLTGEEPRAGEGYREAFARMLTADRQFARNTVNLLWKEMFGLGLVEPVNAFDPTKLSTQPTHPELLEALTTDFIANNYDLRSLLRTIASSSTYQLATAYTPAAWNEAWVADYARHYPRRVMSEVLLDAVTRATNVPVSITVQGFTTPFTKAVALPDPTEGRGQLGNFLNAFGRGDRDDTARTNDSSISQALSLMNDTVVTARVRRSNASSMVAKTLASTTDPAVIADQLYLATLSRHPSDAEKTAAVAYLRSGTLGQKAEDLQFALLNSLEFIFN